MMIESSDTFMKRRVFATAIICAVVGVFVGPCAGESDPEYYNVPIPWPNHGGGLQNRRDSPIEKDISAYTVANLSLKWTVNTSRDVTATPAIGHGLVFFPSWDGNLYAVKESTGEIVWEKNLTQLTAGIPEFAHVSSIVISRSSPTLAGLNLVVGIYGPSVVLALQIFTGMLVWATLLSTHPFGVVTQSATFFQGSIYVGSSSLEEILTNTQDCCYFQGAFFKIDASTGNIVWKVPMLPDNHNTQGLYSGVAVWGSSPPIDVERRLVFIGTGNAYTVPPDVQACELARQNQTNPPIPDPCLAADNHQESILAVNIDTGIIQWARHLGGYDTWTLICQITPTPSPNCPKIIGPDFDFGEAPMLLSIKSGRGWRDIVVAGQKSGFVHSLDRNTGEVVWQTDVGPEEALVDLHGA